MAGITFPFDSAHRTAQKDDNLEVNSKGVLEGSIHRGGDRAAPKQVSTFGADCALTAIIVLMERLRAPY